MRLPDRRCAKPAPPPLLNQNNSGDGTGVKRSGTQATRRDQTMKLFRDLQCHRGFLSTAALPNAANDRAACFAMRMACSRLPSRLNAIAASP